MRISLRTVTLDVPPREIINRDNVTVSVNAVIYFRVLDPRLAIVEVENYLSATSQLAQLRANTRLPKTWFRRDWP